MESQTLDREFNRVLELAEFDLDYTSLNDHFKDLSKLAARVAGTDISLVNIIDSYTQWTVSKHGLDIDSMPREESVCQHTILNGDHLEIKDLSKDDRVKNKFYVTGDPHLRYYFGLPLKTSEGNNLGALCVLDTEEKDLSPEKIELLKIIANEIVSRLENTKEVGKLQSKIKDLTETQRKVSHDIRGPLGGIIGLSELIKEKGKENKIDEILEMMDLIKQGGKSILELAEEILGSSDEKQPGQNEFNLKTFKRKLEQLYLPQAKTKGVELNVEISEKNVDVPFLKNKLIQITGNLISNAIKFTPKDGRVTVAILLNNNENDKTLHVNVIDTGVGIDENQLAEIQNGEGKSTNGTSGERGYGFGLSLVKHLVENLNGSLEIQSEVGKGTTFNVALPRE
ncbi:MAG: GAF domain-containing protein [Bacteroidetes bacterium]|jgi:signal transduction histidine kinase|nr:GAF domain-containing protein [Bacteroidota bacterium]